jgi:rubredoxin
MGQARLMQNAALLQEKESHASQGTKRRHFSCDTPLFMQRLWIPMSENKTWMCLICGWIYDEAAGDPAHNVPAGTAWSAVPVNWICPECGARKEDFEMVQI